MAEKVISQERLDYTVDLLVAMAVEEIAEETGREAKFVLADFVHADKAYQAGGRGMENAYRQGCSLVQGYGCFRIYRGWLRNFSLRG